MLKKLCLIGLLALMTIIFVACSNPVQDELVSYINDDLPSIAEEETEILDIYRLYNIWCW